VCDVLLKIDAGFMLVFVWWSFLCI
jgi:hypothetical protein